MHTVHVITVLTTRRLVELVALVVLEAAVLCRMESVAVTVTHNSFPLMFLLDIILISFDKFGLYFLFPHMCVCVCVGGGGGFQRVSDVSSSCLRLFVFVSAFFR